MKNKYSHRLIIDQVLRSLRLLEDAYRVSAFHDSRETRPERAAETDEALRLLADLSVGDGWPEACGRIRQGIAELENIALRDCSETDEAVDEAKAETAEAVNQ